MVSAASAARTNNGIRFLGLNKVTVPGTDIDYTAASSDLETDAFAISFAVNDNLSISYGQSETEKDGSTVDQELSGFSIGYSMGGMTLKAHKNKGEKIANTANNESEHTEIAISFAF